MAPLLDHMLADEVSALLDDPRVNTYGPEVERFYSRDVAFGIIQAAIRGHSVRQGSTASVYAALALFEAIGLKGWTFDQEEADALQRFRQEKAAALANHTPPKRRP